MGEELGGAAGALYDHLLWEGKGGGGGMLGL